MIWKFFVPKILVPGKSTKYQQLMDHPKKSLYLKNQSLDFSDFLHEIKWQWILKSYKSKILKKIGAPLLGTEIAHFEPEKASFGKKLLNVSLDFFWNNFRTNWGCQTRPGGLFPEMLVFRWQKFSFGLGPDFARNGHKSKTFCWNHMNFFIFNIEHWNIIKTWDDCK